MIHVDVEKRMPGGELDLCKYTCEGDDLDLPRVKDLASSRFEATLFRTSHEPTGRVLVYTANGWGTTGPIYTLRVRLDEQSGTAVELIG